jgi:lysophospholipase L1-like esterase
LTTPTPIEHRGMICRIDKERRMIGRWLACAVAFCLGSAAAAQGGIRVVPAPAAEAARVVPLPVRVGGRALRVGTAATPRWRRQWPGTYFETGFVGAVAGFRVGPGEAILNLLVDGRPVPPLVRPAPGFYRIEGLSPGRHVLRVEIATEDQGWATEFDGFYAPRGTRALPPAPRSRQIEFIGDSHTVGYGNISPKRECSREEVWATTDASRGIGPLTARRYGADYQVNAISGRGIVRNYGGGAGDTLPAAYPFTLLDHAAPYRDPVWRPRIVVVALGTNDFSTPLKPGEKWASRDALHEDFETSYVRFVRGLRARDPRAFFILWAIDLADGEIASEVQRVAARLRASGERRLAFIPVTGLALSACDYHPSLADDRRIAAAIGGFIDAHPGVWGR